MSYLRFFLIFCSELLLVLSVFIHALLLHFNISVWLFFFLSLFLLYSMNLLDVAVLRGQLSSGALCSLFIVPVCLFV